MGRHSTFTQEIADEIIERITTGETLQSICSAEHMPAVRTVSDWTAVNSEFAAAFARAREAGADAIAASCLAIADRPIAEVDASADVSNRKLQIETRLKLLAKWFPTRYGDKLDISGTTTIEHKVSDMDELERAKRVAFVIARGLAAQRKLVEIEDKSDA